MSRLITLSIFTLIAPSPITTINLWSNIVGLEMILCHFRILIPKGQMYRTFSTPGFPPLFPTILVGDIPEYLPFRPLLVLAAQNTLVLELTITAVDGLRIDTAKHVRKPFWKEFNLAAGVYSMGEVYHGDPGYTCDYQKYIDGLVNYPMYDHGYIANGFVTRSLLKYMQLLPSH